MIHGPEGDCENCIDRGDWCPDAIADPAYGLAPRLTTDGGKVVHGPDGNCTDCWANQQWCRASYQQGPSVQGADDGPGRVSELGSGPAAGAVTSLAPDIMDAQGRPVGGTVNLTPLPNYQGAWVDDPVSAVQSNPVLTDGHTYATGPIAQSSTPVDNPEDNSRTCLVDGQPAGTSGLCSTCEARKAAEAAATGSPANEDPATWGAEPIEQPQIPTSGNPALPQVSAASNLPGTVLDSSRPSLAAFMGAAKAVPMGGNTPWAAAYANELREIVRWHGDNSARNLQRHLGPSEIGHPCDRQVVGKLAGFPKTNHVVDPWPSIVGTAIHSWMDITFQAENERTGVQRWLPERKVTPHPEHPGTSDLYDAQTFTVVDHKNLGKDSMAKLRSPDGPPIHYQFQLKLYARGYRNLGLRVDRIVIIGWPRTGSSLDGAYAWEHVLTPKDDQQLEQLFQRMAWRNQWAAAINQGLAKLGDVPAMPDPDECYRCPFYRPQAARDGGPGCPGHAGL